MSYTLWLGPISTHTLHVCRLCNLTQCVYCIRVVDVVVEITSVFFLVSLSFSLFLCSLMQDKWCKGESIPVYVHLALHWVVASYINLIILMKRTLPPTFDLFEKRSCWNFIQTRVANTIPVHVQIQNFHNVQPFLSRCLRYFIISNREMRAERYLCTFHR